MGLLISKTSWAEKLLALACDKPTQDEYPEWEDLETRFTNFLNTGASECNILRSDNWGARRISADPNLKPQVEARVFKNKKDLSDLYLEFCALVLILHPYRRGTDCFVCVRDLNGSSAYRRVFLEEADAFDDDLRHLFQVAEEEEEFVIPRLYQDIPVVLFEALLAHLLFNHSSGYAVLGKLADGTGSLNLGWKNSSHPTVPEEDANQSKLTKFRS